MQDRDGPTLQRSLGLFLLILYGLGIIIGAGVYVVVGDIIAVAGPLAVWSFLLAGVVAGLIALCYAELGARFPEAAGAAAYVREAFRSDRLSQLTGFAVAAVTLVSAATIATGTAGYAQTYIDLHETLIATATVVIFTGIACLGVKDSVRMAAVMTFIEIAGLLIVISAGMTSVQGDEFNVRSLFPGNYADLRPIAAGAFLAFFAFTGFENLANMAEEAKDARRTIPRAIMISLLASTALYLVVTLAVTMAMPPGSSANHATPLLSVMQDGSKTAHAFSLLALIAVSNGVLIQILMLARLFYGMARRSLLPQWLGRVSGRQNIPVNATLIAGDLVLMSTVALPFESLLRLSTSLTLLVFAVVSLSLWRLKRGPPCHTDGFKVPLWVPAAAITGSLGLIAMQF